MATDLRSFHLRGLANSDARGRSTALFVRRYGKLTDWLSFFLFMGAALPVAFVRELFRGNQAAVWAKARGVVAGLREPLAPPPGIDAPAAQRR